MESKNKELDRIITNLSSDKTQSINPLSMILNGIIDAAVMGGIAKYEEVGSDHTLPPPPPHQIGVVIGSVMGGVGKYEEVYSYVTSLPSLNQWLMMV